MSDRDTIINWLERVERRIRANKLFQELTLGLTLFLTFPLALKIWDLFSPLRGRTITIVIALWIAAFAGYLVWRLLQKGTLGQAAASVDRQAGLHDELKTALWFIRNPRPSEWIDAQIQRAARNTRALDPERLYPRSIPRTSYIAAAMILVFVALNFVPLSWNHNWLQLEAAPAFSLTDKEQAAIKQAVDLLLKAEKLQQTELAERLEDIVQQLQQGKIDASQAAEMLNDIQSKLEEGNLDLGSINDGLEEIAKDLQNSDQTKATADAMMQKQLDLAADELRKLAEKLGANTPEANKDLQKSLQQASENPRPGLEELLKQLKEAAENLKNQDQQGAQDSLDSAAQELNKLENQIQAQQLKNLASEQLQSLEQSLRQRQQNSQGKSQQQRDQQQQSQSGETAQAGEKGDAKGGQPQAGQPGQDEPGDDERAPGEAGEPQGGSQQGSGLNPSGQRGGNAPREGSPTELDVKLQQEKLDGMQDKGTKPEDIEEASKQERSKLDYRNIKSELSPAQKDLLNQDRIPWEYRPLIKNYFQAIRPPVKKQEPSKQ
jgi:Ca-activated chloride channel family protein